MKMMYKLSKGIKIHLEDLREAMMSSWASVGVSPDDWCYSDVNNILQHNIDTCVKHSRVEELIYR